MAATSVPQLIAYAETVGYAGSRGLATAGPPLAAWGLATGSPYLNAGVTAVTALMAKADLNGEAYKQEHGEEEYVYLVAAYSLYIGIASLILAAVGFGRLARKVPQPVRAGFKWGCSIGVLFAASSNGFFARGAKQLKQNMAGSVWKAPVQSMQSTLPGAAQVASFLYTITHFWEWSVYPAIIFVLGTLFILKSSKILPKWLPPGSEVIILTAVATLYSMYGNYPGDTVGEIPPADPNVGINIAGLHLPVETLDWRRLIFDTPIHKPFGNSYILMFITALLFAAINFLSLMGIAAGFETDNGIPWSAERELSAQGWSNLAAAAVGSAPVSGSLSRSLVSRMTGTTSSFACIITALCWICLQPYMSIMTPTPKAALSAVIVSAVITGVAKPKDLQRLTGQDKMIGWVTGVVTMLTNPTQGFAFGLIFYYAMSYMQSKQSKSVEMTAAKKSQ
jgi:MFS superfamily sulfate permease-like transporter